MNWESPRELALKSVTVAEAIGRRKCSVSNKGESREIAAFYTSFGPCSSDMDDISPDPMSLFRLIIC